MARAKQRTKTRPIQQAAKEPYPGYFSPERVAWREKIDQMQREALLTMLPGFASFVINQGRGATTASGKTWLDIGRERYGTEVFNKAMREEITRRRENRARST